MRKILLPFLAGFLFLVSATATTTSAAPHGVRYPRHPHRPQPVYRHRGHAAHYPRRHVHRPIPRPVPRSPYYVGGHGCYPAPVYGGGVQLYGPYGAGIGIWW